MRPFILFAGLAGLTTANIMFHKVQPMCTYNTTGYTGCLLGQRCTEDNTCEAINVKRPTPLVSPRGDFELVVRAPREDGRCGDKYERAPCDALGPFGGCCSSHGFCGRTADHCLVSRGCQAGCVQGEVVADDPPPTNQPSSPPRDDGHCGTAYNGATCDPNGKFGGCCSRYGFCGRTDDHCLPSNGCQSGCTTPTTTDATPEPPVTTGEPVLARPTVTQAVEVDGPPTEDGSCGVNFGNMICGNWEKGGCCSMYGYCGNTTSHCGDGCQSGPCLKDAVVPAPVQRPAPMNPNPGTFKYVGDSGVPVMHAGLMPNGKVAFYDKVENYTQLKLPNGQFAYASEWDPNTKTNKALSYKTNAFCAGGVFMADGTFISLGGNGPLDFLDPTVGNGFKGIRYLKRSLSDNSLDGRDWSEPGNKLASERWYPSAQVLSDGSIFVASGSFNGLDPSVPANNNPTYEMLNRDGVSDGKNIPMELLVRAQPYYMYPFIHLLPDSSLFVFASKSSELFSPARNATIKKFPDLPGQYRTYPNTGGSVMLPLSSANNWSPEVVICGGGSYQDITSPTDPSCGRIAPLAQNPRWEMDAMPEGRGMVEGTLLPDGTVIWLNGCNHGAQGFELAGDPTLEALIYDPSKPNGQRWSRGAKSGHARLYHSVALLLLDGTVMVTGSNPVEQPILEASREKPYVTDFSIEIYTPPYLSGANAQRRPTNIQLSSKALRAAPNSKFDVNFTASSADARGVKIALYHGGFVTHSLHMGHRMLFLDFEGWTQGQREQKLKVTIPDNRNSVPPGPYVVYVVVDGVPGVGQTVMVS